MTKEKPCPHGAQYPDDYLLRGDWLKDLETLCVRHRTSFDPYKMDLPEIYDLFKALPQKDH